MSSLQDGTAPDERLVGALIPPGRRRSSPRVPLLVPALPRLGLPPVPDPGTLLIDTARLDGSGRFSARGLLRALGWSSGHRVDVAVVDDAVVFGSSVTGRQAVGSRGELAIPVSARELAGLPVDGVVVLVAVPGDGVLVAHAQAVVAGLLAGHYVRLAGGRDGG